MATSWRRGIFFLRTSLNFALFKSKEFPTPEFACIGIYI